MPMTDRQRSRGKSSAAQRMDARAVYQDIQASLKLAQGSVVYGAQAFQITQVALHIVDRRAFFSHFLGGCGKGFLVDVDEHYLYSRVVESLGHGVAKAPGPAGDNGFLSCKAEHCFHVRSSLPLDCISQL